MVLTIFFTLYVSKYKEFVANGFMILKHLKMPLRNFLRREYDHSARWEGGCNTFEYATYFMCDFIFYCMDSFQLLLRVQKV